LTLLPLKRIGVYEMKVFLMGLIGACLIGCGHGGNDANVNISDDGSVTMDAPGVHVQTGPGGAEVNAPGVRVDAGEGGANVQAPGVDVRANEGGASVAAPGANVDAGPGGANVDVNAKHSEREVGK
jgi:hypothetical protein